MAQKKKDNIILLVCAVVFVLALVAMIGKWYSEKKAQEKYESMSQMSTEMKIGDEIDVFSDLGIDNPGKVLDWDALWAENEDIYAWIYIPDTNIDYPVLQHATDNSYYLNYNIDGTKGYPGCIYTENFNSKDFSDNNTVIYGHNMRNGSMFADVHEFKDREFFDNHRYVYIYTPDKIMIYEIFANYVFTNAHILYSFDCFSKEGYEQYIDMIFDTFVNMGIFREGVTVNEDTPMITMSTCVTGQNEKRLLLQAVYVGEKEL